MFNFESRAVVCIANLPSKFPAIRPPFSLSNLPRRSSKTQRNIERYQKQIIYIFMTKLLQGISTELKIKQFLQ